MNYYLTSVLLNLPSLGKLYNILAEEIFVGALQISKQFDTVTDIFYIDFMVKILTKFLFLL